MQTPAIKGFVLALDRDAIEKWVVAIVSAAATAAFAAGADKLIQMLQADPKYAVWAVVVTALVAAFSKAK